VGKLPKRAYAERAAARLNCGRLSRCLLAAMLMLESRGCPTVAAANSSRGTRLYDRPSKSLEPGGVGRGLVGAYETGEKQEVGCGGDAAAVRGRSEEGPLLPPQ